MLAPCTANSARAENKPKYGVIVLNMGFDIQDMLLKNIIFLPVAPQIEEDKY